MLLNGIPILYHKPVGVSGLTPLLHHVLPWTEIYAAVIKNGIYHNTDPQCMCFLYQLGKFLIGSKVRIDFCVIPCVVFVSGFRFHDRV